MFPGILFCHSKWTCPIRAFIRSKKGLRIFRIMSPGFLPALDFSKKFLRNGLCLLLGFLYLTYSHSWNHPHIFSHCPSEKLPAHLSNHFWMFLYNNFRHWKFIVRFPKAYHFSIIQHILDHCTRSWISLFHLVLNLKNFLYKMTCLGKPKYHHHIRPDHR